MNKLRQYDLLLKSFDLFEPSWWSDEEQIPFKERDEVKLDKWDLKYFEDLGLVSSLQLDNNSVLKKEVLVHVLINFLNGFSENEIEMLGRYYGRKGKWWKTHNQHLNKYHQYIFFNYTKLLDWNKLTIFSKYIPSLNQVYFGPKFSNRFYKKLPKPPFYYRKKTGFPILRHPVDLAMLLKCNVSELLYYIISQKGFPLSYYVNLKIKKFNGEYRNILIPTPRLKYLQRKILDLILYNISIPDYITGFIPNKSIRDNAKIHLYSEVIIKLDLRRFFPSINWDKIFQVFRGIGLNKPISGVLTCLCSYWDGTRRYLPQGAPTSPMIANLCALKMDMRLKGLADKFNYRYSRYADDITFSHPKKRPPKILHSIIKIIREEKFQPNFKKINYISKRNSPKITGIITGGEKLSIPKKWRKILRAEIHQYSFIKNEEEKSLKAQIIQGKLSFLNMIDPDLSKRLEKIWLSYQ